MRPIRVMRLLTRPNLGGPARQCDALAEVFPSLGLRQLWVHGTPGRGEVELPLRTPRLAAVDAERRGPLAEGVVKLRELRPGLDPAGDLMSLSALLRLARSFRPEILHSHTAKAGMLAAILAGRLRIPLVHSFHGHVMRDYFSGFASRVLSRVEAGLGRRRSLVLSVSESCETELRELGVVDGTRSRVVAPAVPPPERSGTRNELRDRLGIPDGALAVAFAGRLVPVKDPLLFVETVARLDELTDRTVLAFCFGAGVLEPAVRREAARVPIRMMGSDPGFPGLLGAFDLVLLCSRREGLPLAAVEALLAGVPVVGTRVPGLSDLQGPGVRLALRSADGLARACLETSEVPPSRRRELMERHSPRAVARRHVELYREILRA
ncbi:MAG: glycosyltransferase family 4 protein [Planctomycetota bacterium]